jgi:guanine deaminase
MVQGYRARILHCLDKPSVSNDSIQYFEDGLLLVEKGRVKALGPAQQLLAEIAADIPIKHYPDAIISPGFIDCHIHYPQVDIIASYGKQLMQWLETYTFPAELRYADAEYAKQAAEFFVQQLLMNGTTSALVFSTVHRVSAEALFQAAFAQNMRLITGKVLMDRLAPEGLLDTAEIGYSDSKQLIEAWHHRGRLGYAVTPRFALTSTPEQLHSAAALLREYPDVLMQTHLSENLEELSAIKNIYGEFGAYADVYQHFDLLTERSVFAHGIHLNHHEMSRLVIADAAVAFCPTSNLFLGSGLFHMAMAKRYKLKIGLGTDIGAGTSFSMLQTMNEAYKIQQLQHNELPPLESFYLATLGGARALHIDSKVGNFEIGKEADFIVLDMKATPLLNYRYQRTKTIQEQLFMLQVLGDDRVIAETYLMGKQVYCRIN